MIRFLKVLADDIGVCQEMLRIILEDEKLIVKDVIVQSSERNLYGRSVRLDALCILGNGKKCNVEVQRSNKDHHLKECGSMHRSSWCGTRRRMINLRRRSIWSLCIFPSSISLKRGRVIYHVDSVIRETQERVDDGLERVFVNTVVKDGTTISEYMDCFLQKEVDNVKFPKLTNRVHYLKHEEGGVKRSVWSNEKNIQKKSQKKHTSKAKKPVNGRPTSPLSKTWSTVFMQRRKSFWKIIPSPNTTPPSPNSKFRIQINPKPNHPSQGMGGFGNELRP